MREADAPSPPAAADSVEGGRSTAAGLRKKGAWVRSWLVVDSTGQAEVVESGKHAIMQRTGRDLRMLDPALSYPPTVLGRERAIVVNLENIKCIITSQEMIFQNSKDPLLTSFVRKVQEVFRHRQAALMLSQEPRGDDNKDVWSNFYNSEEPPSMEEDSGGQIYNGRFQAEKEEGNAEQHKLKILPFEFVALEACLEATCSSLDSQAKRLEQEAHPALDKLISKINTLNLDRVRHIKSRLVAITGIVQKVRDELEHLLDDDEDMAEMYLTEKLEEQQELENSSTSSMEELDNEDEDRAGVETMMGNAPNHREQTFQSHATSMHSSSTSTKTLDVEELEMILEAYFVQIEGTLNKLLALKDYVDDTEDYINIMLDDKQNQLLQMGVVLTTATLVVGAFVALTGVFGMNIHIELFEDTKAGLPEFLWTVGGGTMACIFCFVSAIAWCRYKGLL